ncbi:MAG: metalloregulator ArsR/SmtB family transcription factor [Coriobacteriia bacterium]|nr:metalloregulator ArsR/SmtB family transcription factor [Coriobacteriia bacterium]
MTSEESQAVGSPAPESEPAAVPVVDPCAPDTWESVADQLPADELLYDLADLFKIFADTTRIKILYALLVDEMCVACIAETVGASQSAVSHQLRVLKQSRLVKFRRQGKQVIYSLADEHVHHILAQGMSHICE